MGAKKLKWTEEEEKALRAGVEQYGAGKWRTILKDPVFGSALAARSNVDLKDKWRNVSVSAICGLTPRDKKMKKSTPSKPALVPASALEGSAATAEAASPQSASADLSKKYEDLILEALRELQAAAADTATIVNFMKGRQELPPHFKRLLGLKLKELTARGVVEKHDNGYLLRNPNPNPNPNPTQVFSSSSAPEPESAAAAATKRSDDGIVRMGMGIEGCVAVAVRKMVEAEAMAALAREAVRESEYAMGLAEEVDIFIEAYSSVFDNHFLAADGTLRFSSDE